MWVPCGYFEKQNSWAPRGKLLHTPVCPNNGNPRVAHERLPGHVVGMLSSTFFEFPVSDLWPLMTSVSVEANFDILSSGSEISVTCLNGYL